MTRQLIVVDTETTGLVPGTHWAIEVAAVNVATGDEMHFVPMVPPDAWGNASGDALQINRYFERGLHRDRLSWQATDSKYSELWMMLSGNTFAGSNPAFDAAMITAGYNKARSNSPACFQPFQTDRWHHRLADLAAYAGPALLRAPNELLGLAQVCERLGVTIDGEHTALGDARATAECFRRLTEHYGKTMEPPIVENGRVVR